MPSNFSFAFTNIRFVSIRLRAHDDVDRIVCRPPGSDRMPRGDRSVNDANPSLDSQLTPVTNACEAISQTIPCSHAAEQQRLKKMQWIAAKVFSLLSLDHGIHHVPKPTSELFCFVLSDRTRSSFFSFSASLHPTTHLVSAADFRTRLVCATGDEISNRDPSMPTPRGP
jgi:hypothetical protein